MAEFHLILVSRAEAKKRGLTKYFSGSTCKKGHTRERYTINGTCCECLYKAGITEERKAYERSYYADNREAISQRSSAYYQRHRDGILRGVVEWNAKNPDKRRAISMNYKAKRRTQEASGLGSVELREWRDRQVKVCYWCNVDCPEKFHIDHYEPLAKGGSHTLDNLVIACPSCNTRKQTKDPYAFAALVGRLF